MRSKVSRELARRSHEPLSKTDLMEAEDEAFGSSAERDGVVLELGSKIEFQLAEDDIRWPLGTGGVGEGRGSGAGNDDGSSALAGADAELLKPAVMALERLAILALSTSAEE